MISMQFQVYILYYQMFLNKLLLGVDFQIQSWIVLQTRLYDQIFNLFPHR